MGIGLSVGEGAMGVWLSEGVICREDGLSLYVVYLWYPQHLLSLLHIHVQHATV
jgi:hypothetical protein